MGSLQEPTPPRTGSDRSKEIISRSMGGLNMHITMRLPTLVSTIALMSLGLSASAQPQPPPPQSPNMPCSITGAGPGNGGRRGGRAGADRHCQTLAQAAGAGGKTWRAYLSTQGDGAVNARDRIGKGPWQNFKNEVIAQSVDELHGDNNK